MAATANPFDEYDEKLAASDLRRYRSKGLQPWTRALIDAIKAEGVEGATLLDIGGGIGAIHHELLDAGAAHATCVEASTAYLEAARDETERRGNTSRVTFNLGDFVDLAGSVPPADIVTLDRVVNSYPDAYRLVEVSADHAQRLYGLVVPQHPAGGTHGSSDQPRSALPPQARPCSGCGPRRHRPGSAEQGSAHPLLTGRRTRLARCPLRSPTRAAPGEPKLLSQRIGEPMMVTTQAWPS